MYKIILLSLIIYPTISLTCDPYTKNNSRLEQYQKMTKELITEKTKIEQLKKNNCLRSAGCFCLGCGLCLGSCFYCPQSIATPVITLTPTLFFIRLIKHCMTEDSLEEENQYINMQLWALNVCESFKRERLAQQIQDKKKNQ